jgi:ABC-2 type transport system permease protein
MSTGTYTPAPGGAPLLRMITAQAGFETRLALRHGEQLLLTVVIPSLVLVLFSTVDIVDTGSSRPVDFLAPGVLALAVLSTAFTGQAIATGFERRYGVLKRLGASPLPRWGLMCAKTLSVLTIELIQIALLTGIAFGLGWSPGGGAAGLLTALALLALGTAAFSGLGLLMAGTLRAEATLAAANLVFLLLLVGGGVVVPVDRFPDAVQPLLSLLPVSALSEGLRQVFAEGAAGGGLPWAELGVLAAWAAGALGLAARFFRWE